MGSYERRLAALETKVKNLEARAAISKETRPHFGSDHQGEKSLEVLKQEADSLVQNFKPQSMTNKEKAEMKDAIGSMIADINKMGVEKFGSEYLGKLKTMAKEVSE